MEDKLKILFACTGNSCRSQMAEGWTRHLKGAEIEAHSAGINPMPVDPRAIAVMAEVGIDISTQTSTSIAEVSNEHFDYVVTLCDHAHRSCPAFPARTRVVHANFEDPPTLALGAGSEEEALEHYRRVRDEIRDFVEQLPGALVNAGGEGTEPDRKVQEGIKAFLKDLPDTLVSKKGK
jgi:arsenate reductase